MALLQVRMQAQNGHSYNGLSDAFISIYKKEGFWGLYKVS